MGSRRLSWINVLLLGLVGCTVLSNVAIHLVLVDTAPQHTTLVRSESFSVPPVVRTKNHLHCRVLVNHRLGFHYEVLESIARRFPLPQFQGCSSSLPLQVDYSLYLTGRYNFDEQGGWVEYYKNHLANRTVSRTSSDDYQQVQFQSLLFNHRNTTKLVDRYQAIIESTCDYENQGYNYRQWLKEDSRYHCVFHATAKRHITKFLNRSCWLTPLQKPNCFFLPADFPTFDQPAAIHNPQLDTINLCSLKSKMRDYGVLATALAHVLPKHPNTQLLFFARFNSTEFWEPFWKPYSGINLTMKVIREKRFYPFQRHVATKCHIFLPLLDPTAHIDYFPHGVLKRLSGSLSQSIGNDIPALLHRDLWEAYQGYLPKGSMQYTDGTTFEASLEQMISERESLLNTN